MRTPLAPSHGCTSRPLRAPPQTQRITPTWTSPGDSASASTRGVGVPFRLPDAISRSTLGQPHRHPPTTSSFASWPKYRPTPERAAPNNASMSSCSSASRGRGKPFRSSCVIGPSTTTRSLKRTGPHRTRGPSAVNTTTESLISTDVRLNSEGVLSIHGNFTNATSPPTHPGLEAWGLGPARPPRGETADHADGRR